MDYSVGVQRTDGIRFLIQWKGAVSWIPEFRIYMVHDAKRTLPLFFNLPRLLPAFLIHQRLCM